jgi:RND family efflux transporter MFP subunit
MIKRQSAGVVLLVLLFLNVTVAKAAQLTVTGVIRAQEEVVVRSEVSGIVANIAVKEGQAVSEGQLLVELRNGRQKLNLEVSRAGLTRAEASTKEAQAAIDTAEHELNRLRMAGNAVPRKDIEDKENEVRRLMATLEVQVASVDQAKEDIRLREYEVNETRLTAPFNATVTQIFIHRGDTLRPLETQIVELVALDPLYAEFLLPSSQVDKLHVDQAVRLDIEGESTGRIGRVEGRVIYVNPTIDAASRTFKVKIEVPSLKGRIRPGMLAQARFEP